MPELSPATLNQMFFGTAWAALAVAVLLILWLLFRRGPQKVISEEPGQSKELTDMMILFQTMREVLHEQKALARDFNQSLDRKVQVIREASNMAVEEYKRLAELQRELHDQIEEARQALRDMMRQAQGKRSSELGKPDGDRSDAVEKRDVPEPPKPETPRPILLARPEAEITTAPTGHGDMIDTWVGLDFGDDSDDGEPPEATLEMPEVPEEPEDPMTVRSALRAILNLSESVAEISTPAPLSPAMPLSSRDNVPSLHLLIYEYNDAGMTVGQIAHELGLGKAEVRLILNLRNK